MGKNDKNGEFCEKTGKNDKIRGKLMKKGGKLLKNRKKKNPCEFGQL